MSVSAAVRQREELAQLREENLWLRAELGLLMDAEQIAEMQKWFGLTIKEACLMLHLVNAQLVTKASAMHALAVAGYEYDADEKIVDVFICKLRAKVTRSGVTIGTVWGNGYCLDQAGRRAVAARLGWPVAP